MIANCQDAQALEGLLEFLSSVLKAGIISTVVALILYAAKEFYDGKILLEKKLEELHAIVIELFSICHDFITEAGIRPGESGYEETGELKHRVLTTEEAEVRRAFAETMFKKQVKIPMIIGLYFPDLKSLSDKIIEGADAFGFILHSYANSGDAIRQVDKDAVSFLYSQLLNLKITIEGNPRAYTKPSKIPSYVLGIMGD